MGKYLGEDGARALVTEIKELFREATWGFSHSCNIYPLESYDFIPIPSGMEKDPDWIYRITLSLSNSMNMQSFEKEVSVFIGSYGNETFIFERSFEDGGDAELCFEVHGGRVRTMQVRTNSRVFIIDTANNFSDYPVNDPPLSIKVEVWSDSSSEAIHAYLRAERVRVWEE